MHIGVDGNLLCGKKTGMGTVVYSILRYWKSSEDIKITVFVPESLEKEIEESLIKNQINVMVVGGSNYFKWEQIIIPITTKKENIDILWCPYNTAPLKVDCPIVVTVHDVIYMKMLLKDAPSMYKKAGLIYRRYIVPRAIQSARTVVTVSQFAKKEICEYFPLAKDKISVVHNSADIKLNYLSETERIAFFTKNHIKKRYILGFGSLETRKNSLGLMKAFQSLPESIRNKYQLVLFGFRGYEESKEFKYINENHINNVVVLEYISDEEKNTLYKFSDLFVFPTYSEGFGIPILEGYANNTPVITSNVTAVPEVAGDAAVLVDPSDIKGLSAAILMVLNDCSLQEEMKQKGIIQFKRFDWEKSSEKMLAIIENAVKK